MELLLILLVLLIATRFFGEIAERLGQPAMVGELVAGIVIGFLAGEFVADIRMGGGGRLEVPREIVDISIFFIMFLAGLEMRPREIAESSRPALFVALGGLLVPLAMGFGLAWIFLPSSSVKGVQSLFVGTALAITAVPVAIGMLMEMGRLHTRFGEVIVSAAIFDDIFGLLLLAVLTGMIGTGDAPTLASLALLGAKVAIFAGAVGLAGFYAFPHIVGWAHRFRSREALLGVLLTFALLFAVLAEALGLHYIIGAFAAGLFFDKGTVGEGAYHRVKGQVSGLTTAFLAPVFFASIGLRADASALIDVPVFVVSLILAAFLGKLIGAGVPAYLSGLAARDAASVGTGMSTRGAVELVVADVALSAGLFSLPDPPPPIVASLFSAVVFMALVTTLLTPVFLRGLTRHRPRRG